MTDNQREMNSLRPGATPVSPETIDWEHARLLSAAGAYGLIYQVAVGLVAKVGFVEPEEADVQRRLAERWRPEEALPLLQVHQLKRPWIR